jgi:hypothetical protein
MAAAAAGPPLPLALGLAILCRSRHISLTWHPWPTLSVEIETQELIKKSFTKWQATLNMDW